MTAPALDPGRRSHGSAGPAATLAPRAQLSPLHPLPTLAPRGVLAPPALGSVEPRPIRRREITPNATLVAREDLTAAVARFVIRPDAGVPEFKPGQYFALGLQVEDALAQRPYSTASPSGTRDEVEFLIRRVAGGTFTPHLWDVTPGGRVWLGPPKGLFTLRAADERTHLFVSTGTGLAPFISMAEALLRTRANEGSAGPRIVVVHGVSHAAELAYRDKLEAWSSRGRLSYVPTISRPNEPSNGGWNGATGRTEAILDRVCDQLGLDPNDTVAYICGNPEMIDSAVEILIGRGFPESAVVREHYWTAAGPAR
jgi:ferredoxin/flavodoxin---NADP+ reductase